MKNARMLLLPVVFIAGSLCATLSQERVEKLASIFHYGAENCHNSMIMHNYFNETNDDVMHSNAQEVLAALECKRNDLDAFFVARQKDCVDCAYYYIMLHDLETKAKVMDSVPKARHLTLQEFDDKISQDRDFRTEMYEVEIEMHENKKSQLPE